jgi:hypothetical protein
MVTSTDVVERVIWNMGGEKDRNSEAHVTVTMSVVTKGRLLSEKVMRWAGREMTLNSGVLRTTTKSCGRTGNTHV